MHKLAATLLCSLSLSLSGCFLVGYDGIEGELKRRDGGGLPHVKEPDAALDEDASALDGGDADGGDDGGAEDAGDMDARVADGGDGPDAAMDAGEDAGDDAGFIDGSTGDATLPFNDGGVTDDAGGDGSVSTDDAGTPQDAGSTPDATTPVDPMPYCPSTQTCSLICEDIPLCTPICDSDNECDIDCSGTDYCKPTCNKSRLDECEIDCRETGRCQATCKGGGDCRLDCRGSERCNETRCEGHGNLPGLGATQCAIVCDPGDPSCGFSYCWGDYWSGGVVSLPPLAQYKVGQRLCPGNIVTCGGYGVNLATGQDGCVPKP